MVWKIRYTKTAQKNLDKLPLEITKRIFNFLEKRILILENPRNTGEALKGNLLKKYWKYRVGNYRIITEIKDKELIILVISIGHRKEVYK